MRSSERVKHTKAIVKRWQMRLPNLNLELIGRGERDPGVLHYCPSLSYNSIWHWDFLADDIC